jgi:hypothetical protein
MLEDPETLEIVPPDSVLAEEQPNLKAQCRRFKAIRQ